MDKMLTIYHLYPDLMDVYADRGNVTVLEKRCAWRGIETQVRTLRFGETPMFEDADIVLLGAGSAQAQSKISACKDVLVQPMKDYIENGGVLLASGTGFQLLGTIYGSDGEATEGLGVLDITVKASEARHIGHFAVKAVLGGREVTLVGFEHHAGLTDIGTYAPLGTVVSGFGNCGDGRDGVRHKNVFATYMHGPILPKNPALADELIALALMKKYGEATMETLEDSAAHMARKLVLERIG